MDKQKYPVYISLTEIKNKLGGDFVRIHKSYIINKRFVHSYTKETVEIPIGKSYRGVIGEF